MRVRIENERVMAASSRQFLVPVLSSWYMASTYGIRGHVYSSATLQTWCSLHKLYQGICIEKSTGTLIEPHAIGDSKGQPPVLHATASQCGILHFELWVSESSLELSVALDASTIDSTVPQS